MAEERKVTEEFAAPVGAAPQPAVPAVGDGPVGQDIMATTVAQPATDEDDLLIQRPWYQRLWLMLAAVLRWLWKFWWLRLLVLIVVAAAVAYHFFAGNGEEKAPVAQGKTAATAPATPGVTTSTAATGGLLTNPDSVSAMASATEERLGKVEETLKSAPAAVPGAASVVVVDEAQWVSQCVSWGGTDTGCKKRLELLRVR